MQRHGVFNIVLQCSVDQCLVSKGVRNNNRIVPKGINILQNNNIPQSVEKQQNYKPHLHSNYVLFTVFTTFEWISDAVNDMTAK